VRNLSETQDEKLSFARHLHELASMAVKSQSLSPPNFLVEVLATRGNISVPEVAYSELIRQHSLLKFLVTCIAIGTAEGDVVLAGDEHVDAGPGQRLLFRVQLYRQPALRRDVREERRRGDRLAPRGSLLPACSAVRGQFIIWYEKLVVCLLDLVIDPAEQIRCYANLADVHHQRGLSSEWLDKVVLETANHYWLELVKNGGLPFQQDDSLNDACGKYDMGYADHIAFSPNPTVRASG
jgi:hypothetical protein